MCKEKLIDPIMMELRDGSKSFIILTHMKGENAVEMQFIPVVSEFVDIFPNEIPGLPRKREVEFVIDLVSGALPILMTPYRMTPTKLGELKKQVVELLEKQFCLLYTSPSPRD